MSIRNSNVLRMKIPAIRGMLLTTIILLGLFTGSSYGFVSNASSLTVDLKSLNFIYQSDGSIKIELVTDSPIGSYQINTIGGKTVVRIKRVTSRLYASYLVRNSFNVEVQTAVRDFDGEPGIELVIIGPRSSVIMPASGANKTCFLVSLNEPIKPVTSPQVKSQSAVDVRKGTKNVLTNKEKPQGKSDLNAGAKPSPTALLTYVHNSDGVNSQPEIKNVVRKSDQPDRIGTVSLLQNQQGVGSISGQVKDERGGVIINADVLIADRSGLQKRTITDNDGIYRFDKLLP